MTDYVRILNNSKSLCYMEFELPTYTY